MPKSKTVFICNECGKEQTKWSGKCPSCGAWNTLEEGIPSAISPKKMPSVGLKFSRINEIDETAEIRYKTGMSELDRVLGGGLVKGSLVLIGGDPGIGKSTLLMQICETLGRDHTVLYVSGEESERQLSMRAKRLGVQAENLFVSSCSSCESIIGSVMENKPEAVIIDSIQTITLDEISSSAGSIVQVRECTNAFMRLAKSEEIPIFIVSHVNKDGGIAGPKIMEHIVDTVLYFEGDKQLSYRILRAVKNRFGSTNEIGVFEMIDSGLRQVENPSEMMLSGRLANVSGSTVLCAVEGTRPILTEIQALAVKSGFTNPRRVTAGFDLNRLFMLIAVLEKRLGFAMSGLDVYVNVAGGLRIDEPAADLAAAAALYSAVTGKIVPEDVVMFGEVGLGGELRSVSQARERVNEAERLGFRTVILPKNVLKSLDNSGELKISVQPVQSLSQAFKLI